MRQVHLVPGFQPNVERRVRATIRDAFVFISALKGSTRPEHWLSLVLQSPLGRATVLAPDAQHLALAGQPMSGGVEGLAVVATAYKGFTADATEEFAAGFLAALNGKRAAAGTEPAKRVDLPGWGASVDYLNQGNGVGESFHLALHKQGNSILPHSSYYFESPAAPDMVEFPQELISTPTLDVALAVGHHRPDGSDWGQYVVFLANVRGEDS